MGTSVKAARRALARLGRRGRTTAIPEEVRRVLVAYAQEARTAGRSWAGIAESVGVSSSALIRWSQRDDRGNAGAVPVEVRVEEPHESTAVTLVSPAGYRIEGLKLMDALHTLRELG